MNRRELIGTAGAAMLWPRAAVAQRGGKLREIGFVYAGDTAMLETRLSAFLEGLSAKGFAEGRNVTLVKRSAESQPERYEAVTTELLRRPLALLVCVGPAVVRIAAAATRTIPIVALDLESDPVKSGFVQSIARPGGNLTGIFFDFPEFSAKWLQLLSEAVPGLERVAVIWDPATGPLQLEAISNETLARFQLLLVLKVASPGDIESAFRLAKSTGGGRLDHTFLSDIRVEQQGDGRACGKLSASRHHIICRICARRRFAGLRGRPERSLRATRNSRGQDPGGRQAFGSARRAPIEIRARGKP